MQNREIENFFSRNVNESDYQEAVDLMEKYGGATRAAYYKRSKPHFMWPQVVAILKRLGETTKGDVNVTHVVTHPHAVATGGTYPPSIIRSKAKLHELWLALVDYHKRLCALGDANTDELCKQRVALMKERTPYVEAFEELYLLQQTYFTDGSVPPRLVELLNTLDGKEVQPVSTSTAADFSQLDNLAIVKKRNSVRTQIGKWQNMLRFQSKSPMAELNPMPAGPKRATIESNIAKMKQDLALLNAIIEERNI